MAVTRHGSYGGPRRPFGSFAGKTESVVKAWILVPENLVFLDGNLPGIENRKITGDVLTPEYGVLALKFSWLSNEPSVVLYEVS